MTKSKYLYLLSAILLALMVTSCRTGRIADKGIMKKAQQNEQLLPLAQPHERLTDLTARTSVTIDYNQRPISLKGRLRMRRDEVVQLTFTALGIVEVAMIEFTPQEICVIDRVNKKYVELDYSSGVLSSIGLNFATLQALFWNRIFIPGREKAWEQLASFEVEPLGTQQCLQPSSQRLLKSYFYTDTEFRQLQQTRLRLQDYEAVWQYDMFNSLDIYTFPSVFDISISGGTQTVGMHMALSNISYLDKEWQAGTNLSRYTQVTIEDMLSILNVLK